MLPMYLPNPKLKLGDRQDSNHTHTFVHPYVFLFSDASRSPLP